MKKFFLVGSLCLLASLSFAQKKIVKEAKGSIKSNMDPAAAITDANDSRTLIAPALTNPETATSPETWKIAGDIEYNLFDNERTIEMQKSITGKAADEEGMYTGLYNMYVPYLKADSLGQIPNEKGKIKNKVRKNIASNIKSCYKMFINGGIYYNNKKDYVKASELFQRFWFTPTLDMFSKDKGDFVTNDSTYEEIKYYAIITSIQSKNTPLAISLLKRFISEPYIKNNSFKESDAYELLANEYLDQKDTTNFMNTLKVGAEKFPENKYFTPNLINEFIRSKKVNEALDFIDKSIEKNPSSKAEMEGVKGGLYAEEKQFDKAEAAYNSALQTDSNNERSLEGIGVVYIFQAQGIKEKATSNTTRSQQVDINKQVIALYQKALDSLTKFHGLLVKRKAKNDELKDALLKLQNVYYNLSLLNVDKSKELAQIEKDLKTLN